MSKAATNTTGKIRIGDDYLELVRRCPLRVIRTRPEYDAAVKVMANLVGRADTPGLSPGEIDYADVLSRLIREYDDHHSSLRPEKMSPIEALKYLMDENGMNTTALGRLVGGRGQASLILTGKRELSKANIRTLSDRFKVSAALFL